MSDAIQTSYDQVPYESVPFIETHPDRLATVAVLFGMQPPPVEQCRVLELGCAGGGNLIPMAISLPASRFVGIDLSPRQIVDGQQIVHALGLTNIELRTLSILDIGPDFGQYDYLICHGVYSWVPPPVQDRILEVIVNHLAPNGVALVSYNTYPGWHSRCMVREMMGYHARGFTEPVTRVQQARAFLDFLARSAAVTGGDGTYPQTLKAAAEALREKSDSYILHEYLEEVNEPIYFHQFIERIRARGLQYLGDAHPSTMVSNQLPREVGQALNQISGSLVQLEQNLDFLYNRAFRRSLLVHPQARLSHALNAESIKQFFIATMARPVSSQPDVDSPAVEQFNNPDGLSLSSQDPLMKAAMCHLAEVFPQTLPFETLLQAVRSRLRLPADAAGRDARILGTRLLNAYLSDFVELYVRPHRFPLEAGTRPTASPMARWLAKAGLRVTNLRHENVQINDMARHLLPLLNGSRDRRDLLKQLTELVSANVLRIPQEGQLARDPATVEKLLQSALDDTLHLLARSACLIE